MEIIWQNRLDNVYLLLSSSQTPVLYRGGGSCALVDFVGGTVQLPWPISFAVQLSAIAAKLSAS